MSRIALDEGFVTDLPTWELRAIEAMGDVIEFWGFKRNQGRVWALLYLRGRALEARDLQELLGLSKGAVSMLTRELEQHGVINRVRSPGSRGAWRFEAETDLKKMVGKVLREREATFLTQVRSEFERAIEEARADPDTPTSVLDRLERLQSLVNIVESALSLFLDSSKFDVRGAFRLLAGGKQRKR